MTLPTSPPITFNQICDEFGLAHSSVWPTAFYGKGGAPSSGPLSFLDFLGLSASASLSPVPGSYDRTNVHNTSFTITSSTSVVWTYTKSSTMSCDVASGASATSITFSMSTTSGVSKSGTASINTGSNHWDLSMELTGSF